MVDHDNVRIITKRAALMKTIDTVLIEYRAKCLDDEGERDLVALAIYARLLSLDPLLVEDARRLDQFVSETLETVK